MKPEEGSERVVEIESKIIEGFENYSIDTEGKVRNVKTGGVLSPAKNSKGYLCLHLFKNGKQNYKTIHRLVAQAFIPNPENKKEVNHINNLRDDNRLENLCWCTGKENMQHAMSQGRMKIPSLNGSFKGENHPNSKLTDGQVLDIKQLLGLGFLNQREIAVLFGVSSPTIGGIKLRKTWSHLQTTIQEGEVC